MKTILVQVYGLVLNVLAIISPRTAGRKGFLLFCRPFRPALTSKQHEFFNTAEKFNFLAGGNSIQGYKWGTGPKVILFLHGWQSHSYRWKAYVEALSKDEFTIYALDAPGHGLSGGNFLSVPLYSNLIEQFIHEKGNIHTVVGHSVGGFSLLYTFYRLPLLPVNRIILLAPPGEAKDFIQVFQQTLKLSKRTLELIVDHFKTRYEVTPEYFSMSRFAPSVKIKGLIIHDEEDDEAPHHYSMALHKEWKKSRLISTKGLGHNLRSASIVKEVTDFIQQPVHQEALS